MTGGYGNSYAQQAGQQAYQGYLQGLNDKIPELYNLALQRYQMEGDKLQNAYNMLGNERNFAYGQYQDQLGQWNNDVNRALDVAQNERNFQSSSFDADRANAQDMYFNLANQDYGRYSDAYDRAIQQYAQDMANYQWQSQFNEGVRQSDIDNALRQAQFDESVKQNTIGNEQWQKQFDETVKQNDIDNAFRQSQADLEEERWNKEFDYENDCFHLSDRFVGDSLLNGFCDNVRGHHMGGCHIFCRHFNILDGDGIFHVHFRKELGVKSESCCGW